MGNCLKRKPKDPQEIEISQEKSLIAAEPLPPAQVLDRPLRSWEIRKLQKKDRNHYQCVGKSNEKVIKEPGSLAGSQYKIDACNGCDIYVLDHSTTIFIDECKNCRIFIGPCKASVFVRDCSECSMVIACQQYRSRDCKNIKTLLYCQSQPVIESSQNMQFGCFFYAYPELTQQFKDCGLLPWNNSWSDIHDFTKNIFGTINFSYIDGEQKLIEYASEILPSLCSTEFCTQKSNSSVPYTIGLSATEQLGLQSCLLLIFPEIFEEKKDSLIKAVNSNSSLELIRTSQFTLNNDDRKDLILATLPNQDQAIKDHNFSLPSLFIEARTQILEESLDKILKKNEYQIWKSSYHSYGKLCKTIFENWADERG